MCAGRAGRAASGQRAGDQPAELCPDLAGAAAASCPSSTCAAAFPATIARMVVVPAIIDSEARVETLLARSRGAVPRQPRRRTCTSRCSATSPTPTPSRRAGDEPLLAGGAARRRRAERAARRAIASSCSIARGAGTPARTALDGMGAQARQARRVQPAAARRDRHQLQPSSTAISSVLPSIRYVITLDSDTQLPLEAGAAPGRHAGASAQPAALRRRGCSGSPRATASSSRASQVSVESASRTAFAQVFAGHVGIDPYTTAVSDVYQDLFHEGSYVGKGIYDVDAFEAALAGRVPENTLLSHDLFEGFYARAGAVHRHRAGRRLPVQLPGVRGAAAPLGARRLADRALALAHRARRERRARCRNTLPVDRALEDPRQPAPQPARRRRWSRCSSPAGRSCRDRRCSGRRWRCWCSRFPPTSRSDARWPAAFRGVPLREHFLAERDNLADQRAPGVPLDGRSCCIRAW